MHLQRTHYNGMNGQSRILKQISWVIYNHLKIYGKERVNYIQNYHSTQTMTVLASGGGRNISEYWVF